MFERFKSFAQAFKREIAVYRLVNRDPRTPWIARVSIGLAIAYVLMPFDIVPDFIPILGQIDDVVIVPLLVVLALKSIPKEVVEDCRRKARETQTP